MNKNSTHVISSTRKPHFFFSCLLLFIVTAGVMSNAQSNDGRFAGSNRWTPLRL
jgi:hypothetical protein